MAARDQNVQRTVNITATLDGRNLSTADIPVAFEKNCTAIREKLSTQHMRDILEANGLNSSGSDAAILQRCQGLIFYGSLENCPVCKNGNMEYTESYYCECATCPFNTMHPPRKRESIKIPIRVVKAIHPDYRGPPQGYLDCLFNYNILPWPMVMTFSINEDGVLEINGWRLNKSIFSNRIVHGLFGALIGFFLFNIWSKMSRG